MILFRGIIHCLGFYHHHAGYNTQSDAVIGDAPAKAFIRQIATRRIIPLKDALEKGRTMRKGVL